MGGKKPLFGTNTQGDDGRGQGAWICQSGNFAAWVVTNLPIGGLVVSCVLVFSTLFVAAACSRNDLFDLLLVALPARCLEKLSD